MNQCYAANFFLFKCKGPWIAARNGENLHFTLVYYNFLPFVSARLEAVVAERDATVFDEIGEEHVTFVVLLHCVLDSAELLGFNHHLTVFLVHDAVGYLARALHE